MKHLFSLHTLSLILALSFFWLLNSGHFTPLLLAMGLVSILLVVVIALRMDMVDHERQPLHLTPRLPLYFVWLGLEVVKSNLHVVRHIWSPACDISPTRLQLHASQQSELGKVIYANSITLTPGTVTINLEGDELEVHALTREAAQTLREGEMDRRVRKLEG